MTPSTTERPTGLDSSAALDRLAGMPRLSRSRPELAPLLCVLGLAAITVTVFARELFGHWTFPWDFVGAYSATPPFVAATVGQGHFASWSPFVASGFPVAVDLQAGMYFPLWWIFGLLGVPLNLTALTAIQVAHVLVGAVGVLALARTRGLESPWAAVAALAFLFFGGFYGQAEHADIFRGFAYLPWLLWVLTPPGDGRRWTRLIGLPLLAWLIVSGAYPGQAVSFALIGAVYLIVAVRGAGVWARYRAPLLLSLGACGAICLADVLPYLLAQGHDLIRIGQPTAAARADRAIGPVDLLGLYLNNWAWAKDGSVTTLGIGVPVLVGVVLGTRAAIRRHLPLIAAGGVALALTMAPKVSFLGKGMVALGPLFPSRFPASDYKGAVVIALVIMAVEGWRSLLTRPRSVWRLALGAAVVLAVGALVAPTSHGTATRTPWLLAITIAATAALVIARPPVRVLVACLLALIIVDGAREIRDYRLYGSLSPWQATPSAVTFYRQRDAYVSRLPTLLSATPITRPARVPPFRPLGGPSHPTGLQPDAFGWVAAGYHSADYGGTLERSLWGAVTSRSWRPLLLAPWHAYVWPCQISGCFDGGVRLPPPSAWKVSSEVTTRSYGLDRILYSVNLMQPSLMVDNELAVRGWHSNSSRAQIVQAGLPFRAWRLAAGHYQFTASYEQPGRPIQALAAAAAILAWIGSAVMLRRRQPVAH